MSERHGCGITEAMAAAMKFGAVLFLIAVFASIARAQTTLITTGGGTSGGGSGTVTSVGATVPSILTISGSPVTTSGTLAFGLATQTQNLIFAAPCASTGTPTFRVLCSDDIPSLAPSKITGTAVITSDARLSDARTPTAHAASHASAGSDPVTLAPSQITGTAVVTGDSRLSDSRTPTAHASTHASAGGDPITISESQVTNLTTDLGNKQATGNYITALTGDVVASGPGSVASTIQANSVALGTDTTGGYAGSATEGGSATTADALAVNGTNCSAGSFARGVDASGNAENCTVAATGDVTTTGNQSIGGVKTFTNGVVVDTAADEILLTLTGHSTQTNQIFRHVTSAGAVKYAIEGAGHHLLASDMAIVWSGATDAGTIAANGNASIYRGASGSLYVNSGATSGTPSGAANLTTGGFAATASAGAALNIGGAGASIWWPAVGLKQAATSTKVIITTDTGSGTGWIQNSGGDSYLAADYTNATASMTNTAISLSVINARKYTFKLILYLADSVAADGAVVDFDGGTATMTNFRSHCTLYDTALLLSQQTTAIATDYSQATVTGNGALECHGSFEPSASGTFIVRASQAAHTSGTLTIYRGSHIIAEDMP